MARDVDPWLIALDIDGTLLEFGNPVSPVVISTLREATAAGHHVVLASGRGMHSMAGVFDTLGITAGHMVCANGAVVVERAERAKYGWEVEYAATFDAQPVLRRMSEAMPGAIFAVEDVGSGFRMTALFPGSELDGEMNVVPLEELWAHPVSRVIVRSPETPVEDFGRIVSSLGLADCSYAIGWSSWMDIAPLGVTKASGLERVRKVLGIPPERTMAVGDGMNDIDMLAWAARGVAMGGSPPAVVKAASEVTATLADDGVAVAIRSLL